MTTTGNYLVFTNPGEIDRRLITTMGVNVKDGPSPIGEFGTGLKYAIAVWLREGCQISITSGTTVFEFTTQRQMVRGKEFEFVYMLEHGPGMYAETPDKIGPVREHELGFTTELGKKWLPWMAYRELWSNCRDEGGDVRMVQGMVEAIVGMTRIIVSGPAVDRAHAERGTWLLEGPASQTMPGLEIRHGSSRWGYYQGLRVVEFKKPSLYTYNLTAHVPLTEDRTVESSTYNGRVLMALKEHCQDRAILEAVLTAGDGNAEKEFYWSWYGSKLSDVFVGTVQGLVDRAPGTVNNYAVAAAKDRLAQWTPLPVKMTVVQQAMLRKARAFLEALGHEITEPVTVVDSLGDKHILGLAKDGQILLSVLLFDKGTKWVALGLLEEHLHCKHGFVDESREFQTFLLERVLTLGEQIRGEPL